MMHDREKKLPEEMPVELTNDVRMMPESVVKKKEHTSGPTNSLPPLHNHDASTVHDDEQPSPLSTLPSSQASSGSRKLSPHVLLTAMLQRRPPSDARQPEENKLISAFTYMPAWLVLID